MVCAASLSLTITQGLRSSGATSPDRIRTTLTSRSTSVFTNSGISDKGGVKIKPAIRACLTILTTSSVIPWLLESQG